MLNGSNRQLTVSFRKGMFNLYKQHAYLSTLFRPYRAGSNILFFLLRKTIYLTYKLNFMRQLIYTPVLLLGLLSLTQSCTKESRDDKIYAPETINASVSVNNPYTLNLNDISNVSISRQAVHYAVSQTENEGVPVYRYVPKAGYSGTDEVELSVSKITYSSGGGGCNNGGGSYANTYTSKKILIKFNITN